MSGDSTSSSWDQINSLSNIASKTSYYIYNDALDSYSSWSNDYYSSRRRNCTVVTVYNEDGVPFETVYEGLDELNRQERDKVWQDIQKRQEELQKKVLLRLTDVKLIKGCLFRAKEEKGDGLTKTEFIDVTAEIINELHGPNKRVVYAFADVADFLIEQDPLIFEGWELTLADFEPNQSLTDMPKDLDGFKDDTMEDYVQSIRDKAQDVRDAQRGVINGL